MTNEFSNLPKPPTKPEQYECCDRGCEPCIFDYYDRALERWKVLIAEMGHDPQEVFAALG